MGRWLKGAAGLAVLLLLGASGCARRQGFYLEELQKTETTGGAGERRIAELEAGIRKYRQEVERKVQASDQLGVYYRMLAVRYMELGMFQQAYGALEARKIYPENPILFYYAGICAARLAQAQAEAEERRQWLERAERHYRRALVLDPLHSDTLYALSVLYVYELARPQEAEAFYRTIAYGEPPESDSLLAADAISTIYSAYLSAERRGAAVEVRTF